jgi:DNA-binding LacI/PurR family transcriptional regulator
MSTLNDVARIAGVTAATVSNVLSGRVPVREATRKRVLAAVEAVGYRPNMVARGLARGKTYTIALLVPSLTNPFFSEVVEEMERVADRHDYQILLALSNGDLKQGAHHLERLAGRSVDGFIIMGNAAATEDAVAVAGKDKPVVLSVWNDPTTAHTLPIVDIDFRLAGELAAQHLLAIGHRRIATILELPVQSTRLDGLQSVLSHAGITLPNDYLRRGDSSFESGYCEMEALLALERPPSAVFAGNDTMALGAMLAIDDAGLRIPTDIAVVGVDDIMEAAYAHPALTTVHIPKIELARLAVRRVLAAIEAEEDLHPAIDAFVAPYLVVRQSTQLEVRSNQGSI